MSAQRTSATSTPCSTFKTCCGSGPCWPSRRGPTDATSLLAASATVMRRDPGLTCTASSRAPPGSPPRVMTTTFPSVTCTSAKSMSSLGCPPDWSAKPDTRDTSTCLPFLWPPRGLGRPPRGLGRTLSPTAAWVCRKAIGMRWPDSSRTPESMPVSDMSARTTTSPEASALVTSTTSSCWLGSNCPLINKAIPRGLSTMSSEQNGLGVLAQLPLRDLNWLSPPSELASMLLLRDEQILLRRVAMESLRVGTAT
mmetsp:Transcript_28344/g.84540  ORF Transcript_28344/g.84540 Transcript_28344/m.84540 type:complete len:253 (-) Transcript_28344:739-1497(-)